MTDRRRYFHEVLPQRQAPFCPSEERTARSAPHIDPLPHPRAWWWDAVGYLGAVALLVAVVLLVVRA